MKIRIDAAPFAAAVADAARALPARPPAPVLAGLKLTAADNRLAVAAFDFELSAQAEIPAEVADAGSVLVSGRLLSDITRTTKGINTVDLDLDGQRLILTAGNTRYTLQTLPLEEYPTLPQLAAPSGTVASADLAEAVAQVALAACRDDTLPVLTGIQLTLKGSDITLAATDRYRFAVRTIPWTSTSDTATGQALVPAKAFLDTAKMLADAEQIHLTLPADTGVLGLAGPTRHTTMRALDGKLPAHDKLWPTEFHATATLDTSDLVAAVKRVALVTARGQHIQLHFSASGTLTLTAGSSDDAQARDRIDVTYDSVDGAPLTLAFNPAFFLDGLAALDTEAVRLQIVSPTAPAVLTGANADGSDPGSSSLNYLLMPIRLSG
ncbi:DNA polymerase III subunit beta [Streptomyces sp. NPDC021354]|uniref:DNA polymerase III subunit beta n=1 Tax=Streptomyces sp. NPDC021354 TaxID=3154793 RepID=UPI0033CC3273